MPGAPGPARSSARWPRSGRTARSASSRSETTSSGKATTRRSIRQRKIPALVIDDGPVLTESVAILLTLDERHPEAGLLPPKGSVERAQALRWLLFAATEIYPVVEINDYPERFATDPAETDAMRERAREIWRTRWLVVEEHASGDPYFASDGFSLTDIYLAVVSRWAQQNAWRPAHIPKIERLTAAVAARPAIAPVWARHFRTP